MNKQQNYSRKKDADRIKTLEIENALLKQKLETILTIIKIDGYGWLKNEVIKELDNKTVQKGVLDELVERTRINDFAFSEKIDKLKEKDKEVKEKSEQEQQKENGGDSSSG